MKKCLSMLVLAGMCVCVTTTPGLSAVEMSLQSTLQLKESPVDVEVSVNGKWVFVLTGDRNLLVYGSDGTLEGTIAVERSVDGIKAGPQEDILFLIDSTRNTVQAATLDFVRAIDVSGSPFKGTPGAPVVVAVFSDFQCGYCGRIAPLFEQVLERYPGKVQVVFKHFPLRSHAFAAKAAAAATAAHRQGKFWEFHDRLFSRYNSLDDTVLKEIAAAAGLDVRKWEEDMKDPALVLAVERDVAEGIRAGVRGTPTVFINGKVVRTRRIDAMTESIDKELAKAGANTAPTQ